MTMLADALDMLAARLAGHALDMPELALPDTLVEIADGLPDWWTPGRNRLFAAPGAAIPAIVTAFGAPPPTGATLILAAAAPPSVMLWGDAALVALGAGSSFPNGWICCGGGSTVAVGAHTGSTWEARIDARNGGAVAIGGGGIWATGAIVQTDDMHAIRDVASGARLNPFGGAVGIARHVWLGHQALVLPGARIGADTVIGARAVVTGALPANTVCAGIPARVIRGDVTWAFEDLP